MPSLACILLYRSFLQVIQDLQSVTLSRPIALQGLLHILRRSFASSSSDYWLDIYSNTLHLKQSCSYLYNYYRSNQQKQANLMCIFYLVPKVHISNKGKYLLFVGVPVSSKLHVLWTKSTFRRVVLGIGVR